MEIIEKGNKILCETDHGRAELEYRLEGSVMAIFNTFVLQGERNKGIAEKLAYHAFKFAIANGLKVRAECPYIKHFIETHNAMAKYSVQ